MFEAPQSQQSVQVLHDAQTNMLAGYPESAICIQRFNDSLNSAIHITYHNWLCSSLMHEPRNPLLKKLYSVYFHFLRRLFKR